MSTSSCPCLHGQDAESKKTRVKFQQSTTLIWTGFWLVHTSSGFKLFMINSLISLCSHTHGSLLGASVCQWWLSSQACSFEFLIGLKATEVYNCETIRWTLKLSSAQLATQTLMHSSKYSSCFSGFFSTCAIVEFYNRPKKEMRHPVEPKQSIFFWVTLDKSVRKYKNLETCKWGNGKFPKLHLHSTSWLNDRLAVANTVCSYKESIYGLSPAGRAWLLLISLASHIFSYH